MSEMRPARELSIGIIARSASPLSTAAKQSSKLGVATGSRAGNRCWQARWEFEPGSPW